MSQVLGSTSLGQRWISFSFLKYGLTIIFIANILACGGIKTTQDVPQDVQAHMDLSHYYLTENQPRRSLKELLPISSQAKSYPRYHFLLGLTYMQLENSSQAIESFQQAVKLKPDFGKAWNNLGQVYARANKIQKAEQAFKKALDLPTYLTPEFAAYNLATLYKKENKAKLAEQYARKALKENWRYPPGYFLLSKIYLEQDRVKDADDWLQKGVEANPNNVQLIFHLAENQIRLGNNEDAIYWFERITSLRPKSQFAEMARDYLEILRDSNQSH